MVESEPTQKFNGHAPEGNSHEPKPNGEREYELDFGQVTRVIGKITPDGLACVQEKNDELGNMTGEDFTQVNIEFPTNREAALDILLAIVAESNPPEFYGELSISGRVRRILDENRIPYNLVEEDKTTDSVQPPNEKRTISEDERLQKKDPFHPIYPHSSGEGPQDAMDTVNDPISPSPYNTVPDIDVFNPTQESNTTPPVQQEFEVLPESEMIEIRQAPPLL